MTVEHWTTELTKFLAGTGWVARWPGVSQDSASVWADLKDTNSNATRQVLLRLEGFLTVESRRDEIQRRIAA